MFKYLLDKDHVSKVKDNWLPLLSIYFNMVGRGIQKA